MRQPGCHELLRDFDLSGFLARNLSNCHIDPKKERDKPNRTATGDTEDEIRAKVCGFAGCSVVVSSGFEKLDIILEMVSFRLPICFVIYEIQIKQSKYHHE